jgi:hypothetical protein
MSATTIFRRTGLFRPAIALLLSLATLTAWTTERLWPRHLSANRHSHVLSPKRHGHLLIVPIAPEIAAAEVGHFDDQLEAMLRLEYLRGRDPEESSKLLLVPVRSPHRTSYRLILLVENDQLTAIPHLNQLRVHGFISHYELIAWTSQELTQARRQGQEMEAAYDLPAAQRLESLPSFRLLPALADFLVFKSQTDWRVVGQGAAAPQPLTRQQALHRASDILDVARFYDLPLDYFLGVGAMENNYMSVNGDLAHTVWKTHAEPGDIVLQRGRKRVLVSDYSVGAWQVSRETLRSAHQIYLKDKRDYSKLSPHLRPQRQLDLNAITADQLTTYAGLVLRNLLDRFDGDVDQAIGAYNGGIRNPNPNYAANVRSIAVYARRVLEHTPLPPPRPTATVL